MAPSPPILAVHEVEVVYDRAILALRGVTLTVPDGGVIALLGANGAGKSTTLKAISNLLSPDNGRVSKGQIFFEGRRIDALEAGDLVRLGVAQVLEGRRLFASLTVEENLRVGAHCHHSTTALRGELDRIYTYFPRLRDRRGISAGYLSGGEQQMAAIGRALMARPRLLLLDEPSLGLAPLIVNEIYSILVRLKSEEKLAAIIAEQNVGMVLSIADYGYVLENGRVVREGPAHALRADGELKQFYLGFSADDVPKEPGATADVSFRTR
jgi:branched-chain amino acid transport system ATP-binding protein